MKQLQAEYKAIVGVIARSLQLTPREVRLMHLRCLSSSGKEPTQGKEGAKPKADEASKSKPAATPEGGDTSSKSQGEETPSSTNPTPTPSSSSSGDASEDPNKNSNENDEKMRSVLTKAVLWLFTIYMFVAFFSLLITPRSERPEVT